VSAYAPFDGKLWIAGSSGFFSTDGTAAGTLAPPDISEYFSNLAPLGKSLIGYSEHYVFGDPESYAGSIWFLTSDSTPPLAKAEITATGLNASGNSQMTFPTVAGHDYSIYSGSSPASLTSLELTVTGSGSNYTWTDPAPVAGSKHYRVERN
jgi:hypothetical protein